MSITTELELIKAYYNDDNTTKTINDLVSELKVIQSSNNLNLTTEQVQNQIKSDFSNISDWSI